MTGSNPHMPKRANAPSGFSLLEMIVTISIIAVLLSLVLPALSAVRRAQMKSRNLANLRGIAQVAAVYSTDNEDRWMGATDWDADGNASFGTDKTFRFFEYDYSWPFHAIAAGYADASLLDLHSPYVPEAPTPYALSCTMMTDPAFWRLETRTGIEQYGSPAVYQIAYPSEKTTFVDTVAPANVPPRSDGNVWLADYLPIFQTAGADGSVKAARFMRGEEVSSGDGGYSPGAVHLVPFGDARHSVGGILARDR